MSPNLLQYLEANRLELVKSIVKLAPKEAPSTLQAAVDDLIAALREGRIDESSYQSLEAGFVLSDVFRARAKIYRMVVDRIGASRAQATPCELHLLSAWICASERSRLELERKWFAALLDEMNEGVLILSPDARILYANSAGKQLLRDMTGLGESEYFSAKMSGPIWGRVTPQEFAARAREQKREEFLVRGSWTNVKYGGIYDAAGDISAITLVGRNIHDRRLAETKLLLLSKLAMLVGSVDYEAAPEAFARSLVPELADWALVNLFRGDEPTAWSIAMRDPAKWPLRDALQKVLPRWRHHPLWRELLTGGFQLLTQVSDEHLRVLATTDEEYRVLAQLGVRSLMVVPLVSRAEIIGLVTMIFTEDSGRRYGRDDSTIAEEFALYASYIIENDRLLKELGSSEARFRIVLAAARTAVFEQDASLRYVYLYYPEKDLSAIGKTDRELFASDEADRLLEIKKRVLEGESFYGGVELTIEGEKRSYIETLEPIYGQHGAVTGVVGAATDITGEKQVQKKLSEEVQFREQLMTILSHDLRNPLSAVTAAVDLLGKREDVPADLHASIKVLERSTDRITEMTHTLLDVARARSLGGLPISPSPTDLADVVREIVAESRATWPHRLIEAKISSGNPKGVWDRARICQAISDLIGNAIQHGDPKSPVTVTAGFEADDVSIAVHNLGPVTPPSLLPVLFRPFTRNATRSEKSSGLGFGLYIVSRIVEAHGGTVEATSTAEAGTTFTIRLSRRPAAATDKAA
jgi:signal transduction histidine kinase